MGHVGADCAFLYQDQLKSPTLAKVTTCANENHGYKNPKDLTWVLGVSVRAPNDLYEQQMCFMYFLLLGMQICIQILYKIIVYSLTCRVL
jgi:hypothetical protein